MDTPPHAVELDEVESAFIDGFFAARNIGDEPTEEEMAEALGALASWQAAEPGRSGP